MTAEIGQFLRARRARVQPASVGLPPALRRRVPGLRREEVALLAGVSVDYYVKLEQGRGRGVSDPVLDAIARVLGLDAAERAHLRNLARAGVGPAAPQRVRPGVRRLLDAMADVPAFVLGRRMDVLAWNALGDAVFGLARRPPAERNMVRHVFLDPGARSFYPEWDDVAAEVVGYLRLDAGRHPGDPDLEAMVAELSRRSPEFARLWDGHAVAAKTHGRKLVDHPEVGALELSWEALALSDEDDQLLVTSTAAAGSAAAERLRLLGSWTAPAPAG